MTQDRKDELRDCGIETISDDELEEIDSEQERRESAQSDGMELTGFIQKVSDMVSSDDKTAVLNWVEFAGFMREVAGGNRTLEMELLEIYRPLCYVKSNFSSVVLQQSLKLEMLGNEIIFGAMLFAAGYSEVDVRELANDGVFEDGFIPYGTDEKASLSVIGIQGRDDLLFIECYQGADPARQRLKGAAVLAGVRGTDIETILTEEARKNRDVWKITHPKLLDAAKISCTASAAFEHITLYDPEKQEIVQCRTEGMTVEQREALFRRGVSEPADGAVQHM